jgi:5-amino-6-(5-phosphoribosylamino)uracil reductase
VDRPTVILNVASSLDGKIASPFRVSLTGPADKRRVETHRAECDAVLLGAETIRLENAVARVRSADLLERRRQSGMREQPIQVVWSRSGRLSPKARFFTAAGLDRVVFLAGSAPESVTEELRAFATVHRVSEGDVDPGYLLDVLSREHGVRRLLLESGGRSNRAFFRAGLVDEIHLTITPKVLAGGDSPTFADGAALPPESIPQYALADLERVEDLLFLHYRRKP